MQPVKIDALLMPNGEILCAGKTLGWLKDEESGKFGDIPARYVHTE